MREIKKHDDQRKATITIILNDAEDVIGIRADLDSPLALIDFSLEKIFMPPMIRTRMMMPPNMPPMPGIPK
jgi:hypothetical protein